MSISHFFNRLMITVCMLLGVTLLCGLGTWQLSRYHEKKSLQAQFQTGTVTPALTGQDLSHLTADPKAIRYAPVKLSGKFLNEFTIMLDNKTNKGQAGYHILVPLEIEGEINNKNIILINRGWIPLPNGSRQKIPFISPIEGIVSIEGYLECAYRSPFITHALENESVQWPLRLQALDFALLSNLIDPQKKLFNMLVVLDQQSPFAFESPPQSIFLTADRHLGYAVQWFGLALTLLIFYVLFHCPWRKKSP